VAKEGEADGRGSQQRVGQQDGGNAVLSPDDVLISVDTHPPGVARSALWNAVPVNWRGTRAPPRPVRTNIRISENAVARS